MSIQAEGTVRADRGFLLFPRYLLMTVTTIAGILLLAIVAIIVAGVIARISGISLVWAEEVARMLLVWLAFLGGVAATCSGGHLRVDSLRNWLEKRLPLLTKIHSAVILVASIIAVFIWAYASLALLGPATTSTSPATGAPLILTRIALPIACGLMALVMIAQFFRNLRGNPIYEPAPTEDQAVDGDALGRLLTEAEQGSGAKRLPKAPTTKQDPPSRRGTI